MAQRPRILVTGPSKGGLINWIIFSLRILWSGGIPVRVTSKSNMKTIQGDGLLLTGGSDIATGMEVDDYKQDAHVLSLKDRFYRMLSGANDKTIYDIERDAFELKICKQFLQHKKPILGICRGMQLINVCLGGTLHQDIGHLYSRSMIPRFMTARKKIRALPKPGLPYWLPKNWKVNSLHHQAIDQLGKNIEVCATEINGLPQMIRVSDTENSVVGVQWHPEYLLSKSQQRIFRYLVEKSAFRMEKSEKSYMQSMNTQINR